MYNHQSATRRNTDQGEYSHIPNLNVWKIVGLRFEDVTVLATCTYTCRCYQDYVTCFIPHSIIHFNTVLGKIFLSGVYISIIHFITVLGKISLSGLYISIIHFNTVLVMLSLSGVYNSIYKYYTAMNQTSLCRLLLGVSCESTHQTVAYDQD